MNVLVDDSLIPFWVHGLLGILGPSLVISTDNSWHSEWLVVNNTLLKISPLLDPMATFTKLQCSVNGLNRCCLENGQYPYLEAPERLQTNWNIFVNCLLWVRCFKKNFFSNEYRDRSWGEFKVRGMERKCNGRSALKHCEIEQIIGRTTKATIKGWKTTLDG